MMGQYKWIRGGGVVGIQTIALLTVLLLIKIPNSTIFPFLQFSQISKLVSQGEINFNHGGDGGQHNPLPSRGLLYPAAFHGKWYKQ